VWKVFPNDLFNDVPADMSTGGRSFLFFAAGIFASTGLDKAVSQTVTEYRNVSLERPRLIEPEQAGLLDPIASTCRAVPLLQ
jgi:hypothetical protein